MFHNTLMLKRYFVGATLGVFAGTLLYCIFPLKFKGEAVIKIGMISLDQYIEPIPVVLERLKSNAFISVVEKKIKRPEVLRLLDVKEGRGYSVKPIKNSDSIIINITADSAELVRTTIDSVVEELISIHTDILYEHNSFIRSELLKNEAELEYLNKRITTTLTADSVKRNEMVTGLQFLELQHNRDVTLKYSNDLRSGMFYAGRNTSLVYAPSVLEENIFYSVWRASLFGAFFGVFMIFLWSGFTRRG